MLVFPFHSRSQPLVRKPTIPDIGSYGVHLLYCVGFTHIVPSRELIYIPVKVLGTHAVIGSIVSSFQSRPEALYAVSMSLFTDIFTYTVVHAFVLIRKSEIAFIIVTVNLGFGRYRTADKAVYFLFGSVGNRFGDYLVGLAVFDSDNYGFTGRASGMTSLVLMLVLLFATDKGFVSFYRTGEHTVLIILPGFPDTMG